MCIVTRFQLTDCSIHTSLGSIDQGEARQEEDEAKIALEEWITTCPGT
jgi:hypothetical protein